MSTVRRRPSIFSYFSFSSNKQSSVNRYNRSDSVTANLRQADLDRHKKSQRPSSSGSDMNQGNRSRLLKAAGIIGLIILSFWFFAPNGSRENVADLLKEHPQMHPGGSAGETGGHVVVETKVSPPSAIVTKGSVKENQGQSAVDSKSGTTKCTKSSHFSKPIVQYVIMIDAGSTGSRIHVYRFNNCGDSPELEKEDFKMMQPGLSSFEGDPEGAAKSLDILMDVAMVSVPESLRSCSPVAVKATAGLRLLGPEASNDILKAVRHRLETKYPFPVVPGDGVSIMEGRDEGVYAWVTTNYLLGKIGSVEKIPTAAVLDLGGASTQIVFEPTFPSINGGMPETLKEGEHKYEITFGGRKFNLYQHSHLGYGLKEARKSIHQYVFDNARKADPEHFDSKAPILNPCIAPGMKKAVNITLDAGSKTKLEVTMVGPKEPSAAQCRAVSEAILKKDAACSVLPCSFNGIHQPPFARTFANQDIYIISYFYDRISPLGMPEDFSIKELKELTAKVCAGEEQGWESFKSTEGALEELRGRPEHCLDLNFMLALLHTGYELPIDRELNIAKKIHDNELGWCLGASLPLLDRGNGGWECKIRQIP